MQVHKYWGTACVLLKMTKVSGLETLSTTLSWLSMAPGCNGGGTIFNWLPWQKEPVSTSASNTQISLSVADVFLILCAMFLRFLVKYIPAPYFWSDKRKKKDDYDLTNCIAYLGTNMYSLASPPNTHQFLIWSPCVWSRHPKLFSGGKLSLIGLPGWLSGKESSCQCRRHGFDPWSGKISTSHRATKPACHSCWACALELGAANTEAHTP